MKLVNRKFYISYMRGDEEVIFPALIHRNTRPKEKPFRLTWFTLTGGETWTSSDGKITDPISLKPAGHIDFKTDNLELIRKKLEKTFNKHPFLPDTDFVLKINLDF